MKKIVTVLGARPQFVKAAVLSRVVQQKGQLEEVIVHTGQHYDMNMSDVFFEEMEIPRPKYNLDINGLGHGAMTGQMLEKVEQVLIDEKPDAVVVYGDTNSTLAGALAAKKMGIKVVHIEAGLRSFNMDMPEEINRIMTDRISDLLSCPTDTAIHNLKQEGFDNLPIRIEQSGDIMKDAVEFYADRAQSTSTILDREGLSAGKFVLATIHRQENTDDRSVLENIFRGLEKIHATHPVVLPLHPRTKKKLEQYNMKPNIQFIDPVGYFDMLMLLANCSVVVTDSGGLQKEAFFNQKHCIIARTETEWVELVKNGYARVVGSDVDAIQEAFKAFTNSNADFSMPLYGKQVGEKIHDAIVDIL